MALPARRHSRARRNKRRSQWKARPMGFVPCERCGEPRLPHRVCPHCGTYRGRQVLEAEEV